MSDDQFKEALDAFWNAARCECETPPCACEHADAYSAARSALAATYDRQEEALEMFREEQSRDKAEVASLSSQLERLKEKARAWEDISDVSTRQLQEAQLKLREETFALERLKAEQLTAEQAKHLRGVYTNIEESAGTCALCADINVALRRLSQSDTGETKS